MHAVVEPPRAPREIERARQAGPTPAREGIEEPHLDRGMRVERREARVEAARPQVVDQQAHPHAALGGRQQAPEHEAPRRVVVEDVDLQVDRALGLLDQPDARRERVEAAAEHVEPALLAVPLERRREAPSELRRLGSIEGLRGHRRGGELGVGARRQMGEGHGEGGRSESTSNRCARTHAARSW